MKKILSILLILAVATTAVFATDFNGNNNSTYSFTTQPFSKTFARVQAMGGAGIAARNNQDSLYLNPASLGEKGLVWNIPNVAVTLYNVYDLVDSGLIDKAIDGSLGSMMENTDEMMNTIEPLLSIFGNGVGKLATVDAGLGIKWGRFAMATDVQVNLLTVVPVGGQATDLKIVPQVDVVESLGLGFRILRDKPINFDIGAAVRFNARVYTEAVSAMSLIPSGSEGEEYDPLTQILNNNAVLAGWAVPVDVGINVNFPAGFTISNVVRNLNGTFRYVQNESINYVQNNLGTDLLFGKEAFKTKTPWSWDLGLGWSPDLGGWEWLADFTLAADVVDVTGIFENGFNNFTSNFFSHLKLGAEFQLFKLLEIRGGLNQGNPTVGVGVNIFNILHLEASYYTVEMGTNVGDKPVDALTIRFNTFWER